MQNTMRFSELHCREGDQSVRRSTDGRGERSAVRSGLRGQITALVVPAQSGIVGLFSKNDCVIPWGMH